MHVNWFKQYRQIIMLIVHFAGVLPEKHDRLGILDHTLATENLLESLLTRCSLRTRENSMRHTKLFIVAFQSRSCLNLLVCDP